MQGAAIEEAERCQCGVFLAVVQERVDVAAFQVGEVGVDLVVFVAQPAADGWLVAEAVSFGDDDRGGQAVVIGDGLEAGEGYFQCLVAVAVGRGFQAVYEDHGVGAGKEPRQVAVADGVEVLTGYVEQHQRA